jgi:hypothetical protein
MPSFLPKNFNSGKYFSKKDIRFGDLQQLIIGEAAAAVSVLTFNLYVHVRKS